MIFYLKKVGGALLLPPGILILLLIYSAVRLFKKGYVRAGIINTILATLTYTISIGPVADGLLRGLEGGLEIPEDPKGDVIVVLGAGMVDGAPDFTGKGRPSREAIARIVTAVRLYRRLDLPIIVSGGRIFTDESEAVLMGRFLRDLGVPEERIILESNSRDTRENALYTKEICERMGFKRPILITSATHMRRAILSFETAGMEATPFPSHFRVWEGKRYSWLDYLPSAGALEGTSAAMHEYLGLLFYRIAY